MAVAPKFTALPGLNYNVEPAVRQFLEAVRERLETYDGTRNKDYRVLVSQDVGSTVSAPSTTSSEPSAQDGVLGAPNLHSHNVWDVTGLVEALDAAAASGGTGTVDPMDPPSLHPHNIHDVIGLQKTLDDITASISAGSAVVFTDLTDTPSSYAAGSGHNYVLVNKGGSAIEFRKFAPPTMPVNVHAHNVYDILGLQQALDAKADAGTTSAGINFYNIMLGNAFQFGI